MTTDQNDSVIGCLEGTIEKAFITVKEIPRKEIQNDTGIGIYIGGDETNGV